MKTARLLGGHATIPSISIVMTRFLILLYYQHYNHVLGISRWLKTREVCPLGMFLTEKKNCFVIIILCL
jgi:hypothetical protein